jgi:prefoldin subunit 5
MPTWSTTASLKARANVTRELIQRELESVRQEIARVAEQKRILGALLDLLSKDKPEEGLQQSVDPSAFTMTD